MGLYGADCSSDDVAVTTRDHTRTMRNLRIAVIDSGVHTAHPHIGSIAGGVSILPDGTTEDGFQDRLGHGTAVMAAIQEKAPEADYLAVKVFNTALRTNVQSLLRAIEWAVKAKADIINLSLGTANAQYAEAFRSLAGQGSLLVSARDTYPGCLPEVVGVGLDETCERDAYTIDSKGFCGSGYPRPIPGVSPDRNLNGISFAVANVTGLLARAAQYSITAMNPKSIWNW